MSNQSRSPAASQTSFSFWPLTPDQTSREQQLLARLNAALAQNKIYEDKLQHFQRIQQGTGPVQEASSGLLGENGFPQPVTQSPYPESSQPTRIYPDTRMVLHDTEGMMAATFHPARGSISGAGQGDDGQTVGAPTPQLEWSLNSVRDTPSMDEATRTKVLLQTVKQYQDDIKEKTEKLDQMILQKHCLLSEHQAIVTKLDSKVNAVEKEKESLQAQLTRKDESILELKQQVQRLTQQVRNSPSQQTIQLRPGVKRGRFLTSKPPMIDCTKCGRMFLSEQAALQDPVCNHHAKAPCDLTRKRMMEMFPEMLAEMNPEDKVRHRYWPCCKQVGNPPPCRRGEHDLRHC